MGTITVSKQEVAPKGRWRNLLDHPRRTWLRRAFFQLHLWSGLLVGLLTTVVGITGSAIVYRESLDARLAPGLYGGAAKAPTASPNLDAMLAEVRERYPGRSVSGVIPTRHSAWVFRVAEGHPSPGHRADAEVFVDTATHRILGSRGETGGLMNTLAYLHYELLGGDVGRIVNGIGAALLLFLSISGIVLWWPGRKRWRSALKIRVRSGWTRLNWDLHSAGGFLTSIFLVALSFTGVYFCFSFMIPAISWLTGGHADDFQRFLTAPTSIAMKQNRDAAVTLMVETAQRSCPGCTLRYIGMPEAPNAAVNVLMTAPGGERTGHYLWTYFDRFDGHLLRRLDTAEAPAGVRLMLFFGPLHFGTWGGDFSKVLWILVGLLPGVLFVSGFLMWWRRVIRRRLRRLHA